MSTFKKLFILLSLFVTAPFAFAAPSLRDSLVRVSSELCGEPASRRLGSGLAFSHEGQVFVLSSEHVVFHNGSLKTCHEVQDIAGHRYTAQLKAAEWGNGLALLVVSGDSADARVDLASLIEKSDKVEPLKNGSSLIVAGFPHSQEQLLWDDGAHLLMAKSTRHAFALLSSALELEGEGEYGMSGGAVLSASGETWVGLLSHQYLETLAGKKSRLRSSGPVSTNHLIAIPAHDALDWAKQVIEDDSYHASFERDAEDQLQGIEAVYSSGMRFESRVDGGAIGGGDGVGIGGGDGVGIGGGDGVGIGGADASGKLGYVEIRLDPRQRTSPPNASAGSSAGSRWLRQAYERLLRKDRVRIAKWARRDPRTGAYATQKLASLGELFKVLASESAVPLAELGLSAELPRLVDPAAKISSDAPRMLAESLYRSLVEIEAKKTDSAAARLLVGELKTLCEAVLQDAAPMPIAARLKTLGEGKGAGWEALFLSHFETTVELLKSLRELNRALGLRQL